jgi:hypothetical protein
MQAKPWAISAVLPGIAQIQPSHVRHNWSIALGELSCNGAVSVDM